MPDVLSSMYRKLLLLVLLLLRAPALLSLAMLFLKHLQGSCLLLLDPSALK